MSFLWHDDPSAPCGRCGVARNCKHRTVAPPVLAPNISKGAGQTKHQLRERPKRDCSGNGYNFRKGDRNKRVRGDKP